MQLHSYRRRATGLTCHHQLVPVSTCGGRERSLVAALGRRLTSQACALRAVVVAAHGALGSVSWRAVAHSVNFCSLVARKGTSCCGDDPIVLELRTKVLPDRMSVLAMAAPFPSFDAFVVVLSARFGGPLGENLTLAHRMGGDDIFDVVSSLEVLWPSIRYLCGVCFYGFRGMSPISSF